MSKRRLSLVLVSVAVLGLRQGDDFFPRPGVSEAAAADQSTPEKTDEASQRLIQEAQKRALEALVAAGVSKETAATVTTQAAKLAAVALARTSKSAIATPPKLPQSFGPRRSQKTLISPFRQTPLLQLSQQDLDAATSRAQRFLERERVAPKDLLAKLNALRATLSRRFQKPPFTVALTSVFGLPLPQITGLTGGAAAALLKDQGAKRSALPPLARANLVRETTLARVALPRDLAAARDDRMNPDDATIVAVGSRRKARKSAQPGLTE